MNIYEQDATFSTSENGDRWGVLSSDPVSVTCDADDRCFETYASDMGLLGWPKFLRLELPEETIKFEKKYPAHKNGQLLAWVYESTQPYTQLYIYAD